ncbi:hypothetical protein HYPSUDRAFT_789487 [Hypholoma sublateritium FD-334 SS-4]|uniref:Uncharacterized protein n=1 Tax=Hypholoma sublateritium (strain FD-334 SS-4) TaxID=945553 RepID=A0A0D2Q878_HYPSF|nr:hypothetical protein HYPSUDRAFT_789487 [Hypholoma sublateritium FD-334 SS-4]
MCCRPEEVKLLPRIFKNIKTCMTNSKVAGDDKLVTIGMRSRTAFKPSLTEQMRDGRYEAFNPMARPTMGRQHLFPRVVRSAEKRRAKNSDHRQPSPLNSDKCGSARRTTNMTHRWLAKRSGKSTNRFKTCKLSKLIFGTTRVSRFPVCRGSKCRKRGRGWSTRRVNGVKLKDSLELQRRTNRHDPDIQHIQYLRI